MSEWLCACGHSWTVHLGWLGECMPPQEGCTCAEFEDVAPVGGPVAAGEPSFEELLAAPFEQFDPHSEILPYLLGKQYEAEMALCDIDGVVRSGAMHHGTDYPCTGSAHFAGAHIRCSSPFHTDSSAPLCPRHCVCGHSQTEHSGARCVGWLWTGASYRIQVDLGQGRCLAGLCRCVEFRRTAPVDGSTQLEPNPDCPVHFPLPHVTHGEQITWLDCGLCTRDDSDPERIVFTYHAECPNHGRY